MREKEGIASDKYPDQFKKETPKNATDSNFASAERVICVIKYRLSISINKYLDSLSWKIP